MVVTTYVCAPSWHDKLCACTLMFLYHMYYVNSDLRYNFLINGYEIFPSLRCTISYLQTISAYDICISFSCSFVSKLYTFLYPNVSMLDLILSTFVYMLDLDSSFSGLTWTTFPTEASNMRSLLLWNITVNYHNKYIGKYISKNSKDITIIAG